MRISVTHILRLFIFILPLLKLPLTAPPPYFFSIYHSSVKTQGRNHYTCNEECPFISKTLPSPRKVMRKGDYLRCVLFPFPTRPAFVSLQSGVRLCHSRMQVTKALFQPQDSIMHLFRPLGFQRTACWCPEMPLFRQENFVRQYFEEEEKK